MHKIISLIFLICLSVQLPAISAEKNEVDLYEEAVELFNQDKYKQAIRAFQQIEDLYPISYWAMKAKLLSGVSNYNMGDYSNAAIDMNEYIDTYPNNDNLFYAYYLRMLSYYMQINKIQLEQQIAYKTLELATEYMNLFPDGEYINDVNEKVKLVTQHIAAKEYSIGSFYFRRGEYLAAIKRFKNIIDYKNSHYLFKSLKYLVAAHLALGLELEDEKYETMLANIS